MAKNPWVLPAGFNAATAEALKILRAALKESGSTLPDAAFEELRMGNVDAFLGFVDWNKIRISFGDLETLIADTAGKAGVATFKLGGIDANLMFELIDERAVQYAKKRSARLIVEISEQMRDTVRAVIAQAEQGLITYQGAAIRLQSTIPLTSRDAAAVDKFIDRQFQRFVKNGLSTTKATIKAQNMGAKYAAKLLGSRTRTIARTEIMDAAMSGRYLGWEAGVDAGLIASDSVKEWIAEPDACPICKPLDGTLIGWNEEWQFPEGVSAGSSNKMPPAHPNCRCSVAILPPDYVDNVFTPASGGKMPKGAIELTKMAGSDFLNEIVKHLPGKHDQATHGRRGSRAYNTAGYDELISPDGEKFIETMNELKRPDGTTVSDDHIDFGANRFGFRSLPATEGFENKFKVLDEEFSAFVKDNPVSVMMPEQVIESLLDDGKMKTIFDMPDAKGEDYLDHRLIYERAAFGYEGTFPNESRPVSGTILPTAENQEAFYAFGENFGSAQVVLKDEVKSRTTYTLGDSLDKFQKPNSGTGKVPRTMDLITTAQRAAYSRKNENTNMFDTLRFWNEDYIEAQVHGGVKLKDIAKIIFHSPMIDIPATQLDELGIKYEVTER